jgi:predicted metal-dependent HD superfamily phosphohydrolase
MSIDLAPLIDANELRAIRAAYAQPGRYYHTWTHIEALLCSAERDGMATPDVILAVVFHDVVYDVTAKDNEAQSAARLRAAFDRRLVTATPADIAAASKMITLGEGDPVSDWFWDADREILAASADAYRAYAAAIRREYAIYPDFLYHRGRAAFLKGELARPHLYRTASYRERFEAAARTNIAAELKGLSSATPGSTPW